MNITSSKMLWFWHFVSKFGGVVTSQKRQEREKALSACLMEKRAVVRTCCAEFSSVQFQKF